jgi:hypothetical protein
MDGVVLREGNQNDLAFIYSTWLKGQYYGNDFFGSCDKDAYYATYAKFVEQTLNRPDTLIVVACLADEPSVILAYSVFTADTVYWTYTKEAWRKKGLAKSTLPSTIYQVASLTKIGDKLRKIRKWGFNPWA